MIDKILSHLEGKGFTSSQRLIALVHARRRHRFASHFKSHGRPARDGRSILHKAGAVLAAIIAAIWGDLTWRKLLDAVFHATLLFASIGLVVLGATILAQSVSVPGIPQQILSTFFESGLDRYSILLLIVLAYLVLGFSFDGLSLMIMTLPVVFPVLIGLGFEAIWVGVLITIVIEIGQVTPPVGLNLSVISRLTNNEVSLGRVAWATVPYWTIHFFAIVVLTMFPAIALFLPDLLF